MNLYLVRKRQLHFGLSSDFKYSRNYWGTYFFTTNSMVSFNDAKTKCISTSSTQPKLHKPKSDNERAFFETYFQNEEFWIEDDQLETTSDTLKNAICLFRVSGDIFIFRIG